MFATFLLGTAVVLDSFDVGAGVDGERELVVVVVHAGVDLEHGVVQEGLVVVREVVEVEGHRFGGGGGVVVGPDCGDDVVEGGEGQFEVDQLAVGRRRDEVRLDQVHEG